MTEFEGLSFTSADEALQGRIAGLDIIASSGNLGSGTTMRLRGVSTIMGNAEPLIVVDDNIFETNANDDIDYTSMTDEIIVYQPGRHREHYGAERCGGYCYLGIARC